MAPIEQKVRKILSEYFEQDEIQFETNPDDRVSGFIISEKFADMDDFNRQSHIWSLLRKNMSKPEQAIVIGFIAFTPAEFEAYREPSL
jgi:acid stress-induced BolA-like protein IbaG/YrbA